MYNNASNLKFAVSAGAMLLRHTFLRRGAFMSVVVAATLAACGCATGLSGASPGTTDNSRTVAAGPDAGTAPGFHVLAGEMAVQRGMPEAAARHYVAALEYASSKELARRATRIALFAGDLEGAAAAAREWARLAPDSLDAQRTAARLALIQGLADALLGYSRAIVAAAETRKDGYRVLADVLSGWPAHGDLAVATLRQMADGADGAPAWYALGLVSLRYDHAETAADAARRAVTLAPSWHRAALLQAAVLIRMGEPARAQKLIEALPGSRAQRGRYHLSLARLLLGAEQPKAALDEFERALELQPDDASARFGLAALALSQGRLDRAETAFKRLYRAGERPGDAAYYLGVIQERRQAYAAAERWYGRVHGGGHEFAARISVARMRAKQGDLAGARALLDVLRARYPEMSDRLNAAEGRILAMAGHYREALAVYNAGLAAAPGNTKLLYGRSLVYEKLGRIDAAMADLESILADQPRSARALNALGYLLSNHSKRYQKALKLVARALELDPGNPAILDSMGWVHYRLGHLHKALDFLQRAHAAFPDPEVAAHLGEVLWQLGRHVQARQVWQESLADHPDSTILKQTMARFTS